MAGFIKRDINEKPVADSSLRAVANRQIYLHGHGQIGYLGFRYLFHIGFNSNKTALQIVKMRSKVQISLGIASI